MKRREFLIGSAAIAASVVLPAVATAKEKPIGSPHGQKRCWRKEGNRWLRRRFQHLRVGDTITVECDGGGLFRGEVVRPPRLLDCGEFLDWQIHGSIRQLNAVEAAEFEEKHRG